jgi:phosphatidate cytidylyltransferase
MAISLFYGDIYFSYIKRKLSIKDFSRLLSSHGGILDRFDSITFLIIIFAILNF